ncbi:alpha-amylase family glycosyl hydrolase [Agreia sp. COWG]|uniref:alpha-amylase family glycosyl hydrolase n=1 Tax=Agreia sp. COWG TaxID=2773266 RepID=UPI001926CF74|nr:alpha-amylase family glycosyl hydrolase [Agreia sp. COWG]CAD5999496.1 Alpha-amylase [Agreia sp. COWG]
MPAWTQHVIWWHVYPLGFVGADTRTNEHLDVSHRLAHIVDWLDDLQDLGLNGLALGPIFDSESHGYDTIDHRVIDPRLGDDADFDLLVAACRDRGVRVLLDGVFNHVARSNPLWQDAVAAGAGSAAAAWFRLADDQPDGGELVPAVFEGHGHLVELDPAHPAVADYIVEVMTHWLDRGADGWRLDAAYAVAPDAWRPILDRVREAHPDAWIVGEVIHGDYAGIVRDSHMDSVTQYELWKSIGNSLAERNLFELAWTLGRHEELLESSVPMTFVGNHDVSRIASIVSDARHSRLAHALLFFLPGVPSVYYGDERGLTGIKEDRIGGDDAVRPFADRDAPEWQRNDTFRLHQELIGFRRRNAWLVDARVEARALANETVLLVATARSGSETARLALNLSDAEVTLEGLRVPPHDYALDSV